MRFVWDVLVKPAIFAGLLVLAIFGTYGGGAVRDDYTWMIGIVVLGGGVLVQLRFGRVRDRLEALELRVAARGERRGSDDAR